jgi:hypothetical protein
MAKSAEAEALVLSVQERLGTRARRGSEMRRSVMPAGER